MVLCLGKGGQYSSLAKACDNKVCLYESIRMQHCPVVVKHSNQWFVAFFNGLLYLSYKLDSFFLSENVDGIKNEFEKEREMRKTVTANICHSHC